MSTHTQTVGLAALTICESLLLALTERDVLDQQEVRGLLLDAAESHRNAASTADDPGIHIAAQEIIERIVKKRNSVRGPV